MGTVVDDKEGQNQKKIDLIQYEEEVDNTKYQPVSFWSMSLPTPPPDQLHSSFFIVKSDDVSSVFDNRPRLPFLIQFNNFAEDEKRSQASMPAVGAEALEKPLLSEELAAQRPGQSLPVDVLRQQVTKNPNASISEVIEEALEPAEPMEISDPFTHSHSESGQQQQREADTALENYSDADDHCGQMNSSACNQNTTARTTNQEYSSIGDSLIDLIIKLKNENRDLASALTTNNLYVKERLSEIKKIHELAQSNEKQFAMERLEYQSQITKLKRHNTFLNDKLKSFEALKKTKSSNEGDDLLTEAMDRIYPILDNHDSFANAYTRSSGSNNMYSSSPEDNQLKTIQELPTMPATDEPSYFSRNPDAHRVQPTAPPMSVTAHQADKTYEKQFMYSDEQQKSGMAQSVDDPMKQCDKLEQKLNNIVAVKEDYEKILLQNQLNICRQDYRFERIAKLEALLQIEKLKNDIDRLCLERLQEKSAQNPPTPNESASDSHSDTGAQVPSDPHYHGRHHRRSHMRRGHRKHHHDDPTSTSSTTVIGKLGTQLSKRALRHAAKAAKKAQIHASKMESEHQNQATIRNQHSSSFRRTSTGSEIVNGLFSTANKAVLTGYKIASNMASTQVNLALEKLNQYEPSASSSSSSSPRTNNPSAGR